MTTLKNKLVDKLGLIPEQVQGSLYRLGRSFYEVDSKGCTIRNTERSRNTFKLLWSDSPEVYDWVASVLTSDDPNARKLAAVIAEVYRTTKMEVNSVGLGAASLIALGDKKGYTVSIRWSEGYYRLESYETGDEYDAGTPEGAVIRASLMYDHIKVARKW